MRPDKLELNLLCTLTLERFRRYNSKALKKRGVYCKKKTTLVGFGLALEHVTTKIYLTLYCGPSEVIIDRAV